MDLLRIAAIGSVDDGKSTLIGRLLMETGSLPEDQVRDARRFSESRGDEYFDLALFTDGLRAEREQGITIDVAYRYFSIPRRAFVLADCPGHHSYTRNMVCGASTAEVVLLLLDARRGLTEQGRRHAFIASMLRVGHLVVCVNKMDLVAYAESVFEDMRSSFADFAARLGIPDVTFIPVSALQGDNVIQRSERMPWYGGAPLLYHLEHLLVASDKDLVNVRLPIQTVLRPRTAETPDYRAYCGEVAGGVIRPGDDAVVLPTREVTRIASVEGIDGPLGEAFAPMNVRVEVSDHLEIARGYMIARPNNMPTVADEIDALICCLAGDGIAPGRRYIVQHTTRRVRGTVSDLRYRVELGTLHRDAAADALAVNDVGRVRIRLAEPIFCDPYGRNRVTGSFVLIDEGDHRTVAAGTILARNVS